jgi:hypothetical protein
MVIGLYIEGREAMKGVGAIHPAAPGGEGRERATAAHSP